MNELVEPLASILAVLLALPVLLALAFPQEMALISDVISERRGRRAPARPDAHRSHPRPRPGPARWRRRGARIAPARALVDRCGPGYPGDDPL